MSLHVKTSIPCKIGSAVGTLNLKCKPNQTFFSPWNGYKEGVIGSQTFAGLYPLCEPLVDLYHPRNAPKLFRKCNGIIALAMLGKFGEY